MNQKLAQIFSQYQAKIKSISSSFDLEAIRIELLGRRGLLNQLFSKISTIRAEERQQYGSDLNQLKSSFENLLTQQSQKISLPAQKVENSKIKNPSSVGRNSDFYPRKIGHLHPITVTERQLNRLFFKLGFSSYHGPEIETDEFCFQRLNVPSDHPAREMQDSIYIREPEYLLRTQGSSIESRLLSQEKPPFKVAFPSIVYRNEKVNKSNHFIFHHYQGVVVDKNITLKDLFGTINLLFRSLYGENVVVRFRTKYYPEVEPGVGPDMQCFSCHGTGCPICKGAGWIEMGGAGIIHPKVLKMAGIDPSIWRGFAFGLGLDRWVMAKFDIKDIRTLLGGNLAYKPNA